jgi:raffinose/stachyose/melibiose transport system permease protein
MQVKAKKKTKIIEYLTGYAYVFPVILFIALFMLVPIVHSLILSFFNWKGYGALEFIGIKNFINMFTNDPIFYRSLKNTVIFSFAVTVGSIIIGFMLAILIDFRIKFWKIYRFLFFLPVIFSSIVIGLLWVTILSPYGAINQLLDILNLGGLKHIWLGEPGIAMGVIIFTAIWASSGVPMLWFLAGLQNIDESLYEAAKIDGASTIRRVISISIPLIRNVFAIVLVLQAIFTFRVFDIVWVMTEGGPAGTTEVLGTYLFKTAFLSQKFGYASAVAVIMFIYSLIFSLVYIRISGYRLNTRKL